MARSAEDMHVEILKLRGMKAQHEANLIKVQGRYADALQGQKNLVEEARSTKRTIEELETQIQGLIDAHGEPTMGIDLDSL